MDNRVTNGKATASMVMGLLGLLCVVPVIGSIVAVILGHIAKSEIKQSGGTQDGAGNATVGLVTGYIGLLVVPLLVITILSALLLPALSQARDRARQVNDANNLKQMGLGHLMFSGNNDGYFPKELAELAEQQYLLPGAVWRCPATQLPAPTSVAQIRDGSGTDYIYVGKGLKDDNHDATNVVIMYTKPDCFANKWMNFLFIDGHVEGAPVASAEEAAELRGWTIGNQDRRDVP